LLEPASTSRGFYVAATRGRDKNMILVVTDSHKVLDAVDTLEQILATDRADTPATTVRRELAATIPSAPVLQPRCQIPDWFADAYRDAINDLAAARFAIERHERDDADLEHRLNGLDHQLRKLAPGLRTPRPRHRRRRHRTRQGSEPSAPRRTRTRRQRCLRASGGTP
jgi:hypothetical protein